MGEAFDPEYGRMSGNLGVEVPNAQAGTQQNLILYPFVNPATEIFDGIELPPGVEVTPIASADDGTQIWKITHNGVDTHPIHFHLYRCAADQPGRLGRHHPQAGRQRARLEGYRPHQPAGRHHRRPAPDRPASCPSACPTASAR